ncbi:hypothetical protein CcaverHIS002_0500750 [Cutaneotrichosporon cavernicola]|uniref:Myb-like domain-containing protein n=1 Tax=Cutaneotrichosporon cavernicola TaxID=279322 RepID=A0AA48QXP9_9TREE|nr:uncharacterized protein CcaverHIS019_0600750 [Cutaneotrichosporon cavernicola]BEI84674.1 hypothetical protein CcaverHIS002_0500750 [Cutaneotrichosporon cavernicola]BEI93616.1 hypothetical protein CcaverHIS019_0600750 [Cutaneotrichosporon cavernicola]BEJ01393.1 hypothetical protein CcaverHIS631_0600750 [Cutaneotrichosporon cavernicola]BEJ09160.1 hypothetical protein CcaverHIS641_0600750 [Cutaneotrichosporon cavernicola]
MPPRRSRSSTISSNSPIQPDLPFRRPRPRRNNSLVDRNLAAIRNINVDSSDVSVDPVSSPTVTSFSGHYSPVRGSRSFTVESEQSEGPDWQPESSPALIRRRRGESGVSIGNGAELSQVTTAKGHPWTSDDLERLYRTVKMTRRDLGWSTVGDRIGDRTAGECTAKWKEMEGRIIGFIRSMGQAGNAGDADESASEENDDRFGDDEWEVDEPVSDYFEDEEDEVGHKVENGRAVMKLKRTANKS